MTSPLGFKARVGSALFAFLWRKLKGLNLTLLFYHDVSLELWFYEIMKHSIFTLQFNSINKTNIVRFYNRALSQNETCTQSLDPFTAQDRDFFFARFQRNFAIY